ncbi:MAG: hypothetical protein AAGH15_07460 [Myxococcota bacterium]
MSARFGAALVLALACSTPEPRDAPGDPSAQPGAGELRALAEAEGWAVADRPPLPVFGGTLTISASQTRALAAEPSFDQVHLVALDAWLPAPLHTLVLEPGDQPWRSVALPDGFVLSLRGGAVLRLRLDAAETRLEIVWRTELPGSPRGLDVRGDALFVATAGGALHRLDLRDGEPEARFVLEPDLRDVVALPDALIVTTFRQGRMLTVSDDGIVLAHRNGGSNRKVAWRARRSPFRDGRFVVVRQVQPQGVIASGERGGYGVPAEQPPGTVEIQAFDGAEADPETSFRFAPLAVDLAEGGDGTSYVIGTGTGSGTRVPRFGTPVSTGLSTEGLVTAIDVGDAGLVVQTAGVRAVRGTGLELNVVLGPDVRDHGYERFHRASELGLACASCHAEGGDDGFVWSFDDVGPRRTQALGVPGGMLAAAPFHWDGALPTMADIVRNNMRLMADDATPGEAAAIALYVDSIPPERGDPAALGEGAGAEVFAAEGCARCHVPESGYTDGRSHTIRGKTRQTPSLAGVAFREPLMHDGCVAQLRVFGYGCPSDDVHFLAGGGDAALGERQRALVAFLATL